MQIEHKKLKSDEMWPKRNTSQPEINKKWPQRDVKWPHIDKNVQKEMKGDPKEKQKYHRKIKKKKERDKSSEIDENYMLASFVVVLWFFFFFPVFRSYRRGGEAYLPASRGQFFF